MKTTDITFNDIRDNDLAFLCYMIIQHTNRSIFLTGKAGTGKSALLKLILRDTGKNSVVLAPTGIAARNIGGQTIHSFFSLPSTLIFSHGKEISTIKYSCKKKNLIKKIKLIVIDEVSMLSSAQLDCIDFILRKVMETDEPFGGKQILFVGDLYQLPPVISKQDKERFYPPYGDIYFYFAKCYKTKETLIINLTKTYRQEEDDFINILDSIRLGEVSSKQLLFLNNSCVKNLDTNDGDEGALILTTNNSTADAYNHKKLNDLGGTEYIFRGESTAGFKLNQCLAPLELKLKIGAQVMILKNNIVQNYHNGTLGKVCEVKDDRIIVLIDSGRKIELDKCQWEDFEYCEDTKTKELKKRVKETFVQYPLMLAWAFTIHKSQGLTLSRVHIDNEKFFAPGQLYVALSRCKSLSGLSYSKPLTKDDPFAHHIIHSYYCHINSKTQKQLRTEIIEEIEANVSIDWKCYD